MRTRFDQFGKQMVGTALAPGGPVQTDAEVVPTDTRRIDVWFMPDPVGGAPRSDLGLLGRIADGHRTFELFHRTPHGEDAWRREALAEGAERALSRALIDFYEARFGAVPPALRTTIEDTHDEPTLQGWVKLVASRSADEIAAAIHGSRAS